MGISTPNVNTKVPPQSNGKIEATVKSMKKLIRASWNGRTLDEEKLCRALLQYRNTPSRKDGVSPAQKLYGRPVQDSLPAHRRSFSPEWQRKTAEVEQQLADTLKNSVQCYNAHARPLPDIHVGSSVAVQNPQTKLWDIYGTVTEIGPHRRYYIKTHSGRVLVRNRRFLRRRVPPSAPNLTVIPPMNTSQEAEATSTNPQQNSPPRSLMNTSQDAEAAATTPQQSLPPRRSLRTRNPPKRLIEDPSWS